MRALLIFLVFVTAAAAQPSFDPYEFINKKDLQNADVNQFWRTLGISANIRETRGSGSKDINESFNCRPDDRCEEELIRPEWPLIEGDGDDVIVRVSAPFSALDVVRFLVFHQQQTGSTWQLVDYLDSTYSHYAPAKVSVVSSSKRRWLVISSYPRCGTGCSLNPSDWYESKNGKFRMVLSVPLSGHEGTENPGRYFETRFVRANRTETIETLEFVFHVEFSSGFGSSTRVDSLWDDEKIIRFFRPNGDGEFKLHSKNSEASESFLHIFSTNQEVTEPRFFG